MGMRKSEPDHPPVALRRSKARRPRRAKKHWLTDKMAREQIEREERLR